MLSFYYNINDFLWYINYFYYFTLAFVLITFESARTALWSSDTLTQLLLLFFQQILVIARTHSINQVEELFLHCFVSKILHQHRHVLKLDVDS